ncbi:MAG TPA: hypothetical protein VGM41_17990 [Chitinophagaceae bacterium]
MKISATIIALLISATTIAQKNTVFLKWKIKPNEVLVYKTVMEDIDTATSKKLSINFGGGSGLLKDSATDDTHAGKELFSDLEKSLSESNIVTNLTPNNKGYIDIAMVMKTKENKTAGEKDTTDGKNKAMELLEMMAGDAMLRGAIYDNGLIQSFYVKNDQKNLIALLFELPGKAITPGDSWELHSNLISMDQHFKCDTSFRKNIVTLVDVKKEKGEMIAILKYDIHEYVSGDFTTMFDSGSSSKTILKLTYSAMAAFSVDRGRWLSYEGVMSSSATGVMTYNTCKRFSLVAQ